MTKSKVQHSGFGTVSSLFFRWIVVIFSSLVISHSGFSQGDTGADVVVIYNSRMPESKEVAEYYAKRRSVPTNQVWGIDTSTSEAITRGEYVEKIQNPILKKLEDEKLWTWGPPVGGAGPKLAGAKVKYAVLCYGVPTKFVQDTNLVEKGTETARPELRRNEASVDSQLACLPLIRQDVRWAGAVNNPAYGTTNITALHPTNGIFLVTRLDGPSVEVAGGLIDKSIEAETNGLWGRVYVDSRGLHDGEYRLGDDWMRNTAQLARQWGFETELDTNWNTWTAGQPLSHIAFYAGWYDWNASGPFIWPPVEFMTGAFAYHLHSFSAQTLRSTNQNWVGPLLARGATCTIGHVDEPYLTATADVPAFFHRFIIMGWNFAQAAWTSQNALSWQTVAVGDPLYRPCGRAPEDIHRDLERRRLSLIEWSILRMINLSMASGRSTPDDVIDQLGEAPLAGLVRQSAVLTEKLADLCWARRKIADAFDYYEAALNRHASPRQQVRILLLLGQRRAVYGPESKALGHYRQILEKFPDYPDPLVIHQKMLPLARKTGDTNAVQAAEAQIKRLSQPNNPR